MQRMGERIKKKREGMNMQVNVLSKLIGVTPSLISQIERGKAFPSILTLKNISDVLHTTVGELIGENEALTNNPVVRYNEKKFVEENKSGTTLYLLSNHGDNKQIDTFIIIFKEGSDSQNILKIRPGQAFLFILQGELEFELDSELYTLKKNDSFYFNSNRMHFARNMGNEATQVIWVSTHID